MDYSVSGSVLHYPLEFVQIHVHLVSDAILIASLFNNNLIFPSTRVFSNESALCIKWSKYWSFSFSNSSSNEYIIFLFEDDFTDDVSANGLVDMLDDALSIQHEFIG